jgi:cell wall assembly regulator SMI1
MPTNKARINITLPEDIREALEKLARRDRVPQATKAARLLETGLEIEEDIVWDKLAKSRDTKNARFVSHEKAWK